MLDSHEKQFHIPLSKGEAGKYCILPGDPGRCEKIAAMLEKSSHLIQNREYNVYNGTLCGELVTVCSTGIGGPSTAIAVEELVACGAEVLIRVGTSGGISLDVKSGDVVVATGAVRQDGTSHEYAPPEFPAVPDAKVLFALVRAAERLGYTHHAGVVQSKDSFYGQHSPQRMPTSSALLEKWEAWKRLGVLASEMEASTLFTVGASLGVKTGAVFHVIWNQERANAGLDTAADEKHDTEKAIRVAVEAIRILIEEAKNGI
ncbi:MAG: uridine phosphorylase [Clostridia bacterium]|nr:uridine phosphorylase [Clostridia bacterium]